MHHRALQNQCPSNSRSAHGYARVLGRESIANARVISALLHDHLPDNSGIFGCYCRNTWVFVDRYCRFTERFTLVLLWLLETLCYSMGNRKYASKYAMKYAMPRYI